MTHLKSLFPLVLIGVSAFAQATPEKVSPDTVVATINGRKITAGEVDNFVNALPGQLAQMAQRDKKEFVRQYALITTLAQQAEARKIDQETLFKGRLEYARLTLLMNMLMEREMNEKPISEEEIKAQYAKSAAAGTGVANTKVLYVAFGEGKRTEAEAKTKIDGLRKQAVGGADFAKIVRENSDDKMSQQNDGNYPPIKKTDGLPEPIKNAIFALKPGEYTEPIRQANGFYIFKLEGLNAPPLEEARQQILNEIRQQRFNQWFQEARTKIDVKFDNEAFFAPAAGAPPAGVPPSLAAPKK